MSRIPATSEYIFWGAKNLVRSVCLQPTTFLAASGNTTRKLQGAALTLFLGGILGLDHLYRLYIIIWASAWWSTPKSPIIFVSPSTSWTYRGKSTLPSFSRFYVLPLSLLKDLNPEAERPHTPTPWDTSALCSAIEQVQQRVKFQYRPPTVSQPQDTPLAYLRLYWGFLLDHLFKARDSGYV